MTTLIGGDGAVFNFFLADASDMYGNARGGNDTLIGGANTGNFFFGDTFTLHDNARGGNDTLIGGAFSNNNTLFGDAVAIFDNARGGDDTLIAGDAAAVNFLVGDANQLDGNARGGNDTLISGTGTDHMWGDAQSITAPAGTVVTGADTFVFAPGNGNDDVNDFRQNDHDRIDVSAWGFHSLADMTIIDAGADTRIEFDLTNSVTLVGLGDPGVLHAADFIFA